MHYLLSLNIYIKNHYVKSPQNIKPILASQEIPEPNVMLEPILRNVNNYKVIKARIKFYIFLFKITIAAGIAFFWFWNSFRKIINRGLSLHSKTSVLSYQNSLLIWTATEACVGHGMMSDSIPYAMFKSAIPSLIFTY